MKFTDIKNQIKDKWEYDGEFIWTSDMFDWFSTSSSEGSDIKINRSCFLEFYNDARDNFFRIYDSKGNIIGFIDGNELRNMQIDNRFYNFIFNKGGNFMFSEYNPQ